MYHAEAQKVEGEERWVIRKQTPACTWFSYHDTEEEAQGALQRFFEHCCLTPEIRAEIAEKRRARLEAQITELEKELTTL